ncbi:cytochrome P450 6k1-like [Schistocerca cancellata]|uniref:cytochrome P450 6k1-like n=1 Tax=Schistocerca cancellata TaxID=274614 RepID=UPI0021173D9D|nr:cytochrome P450 6k1-like [Schistocerca cancellata]
MMTDSAIHESTSSAICSLEKEKKAGNGVNVQWTYNKGRTKWKLMVWVRMEWTNGALLEMGEVAEESLRKYPPAPVLNRECNQDYKIPDSDVVLEKGTPIVLSVLGLHHDPTHFPDPDRFDPERFSEESKAKCHPYVYLPFGEGPRICIGMRMGLLQTNVGLVNILS